MRSHSHCRRANWTGGFQDGSAWFCTWNLSSLADMVAECSLSLFYVFHHDNRRWDCSNHQLAHGTTGKSSIFFKYQTFSRCKEIFFCIYPLIWLMLQVCITTGIRMKIYCGFNGHFLHLFATLLIENISVKNNTDIFFSTCHDLKTCIVLNVICVHLEKKN